MALFKRRLTEQEAALQFISTTLAEAEGAWPVFHKSLRDELGEKFVIADERVAIFDLFLAAVAEELQAVKNLFPLEQADRIERWVLNYLARTKEWGPYALGEVKAYSATVEGETLDLSAIPGRLLNRWLSEGIKNLEGEIGGQKTGLTSTILMIKMLAMFAATFAGFWKNLKSNFKLVQGDLPVDEEPEEVKAKRSL